MSNYKKFSEDKLYGRFEFFSSLKSACVSERLFTSYECLEYF